MIVDPQPAGRKVLYLSYAVEQVLLQPVVPNRAVVALDIGILLRLPGLNMLQSNATLLRPGLYCTTDVFRAIVTAERLRLASPFDNLFQTPDNTL